MFTTIANLQTQISALQKQQGDLESDLRVEIVATRKVGAAALKAKIEDLRGKINLMADSTLPGLPVVLCILLDTHHMQLGFNPYHQSQSQFILRDTAQLAAITGVAENKIETFFQYLFLL